MMWLRDLGVIPILILVDVCMGQLMNHNYNQYSDLNELAYRFRPYQPMMPIHNMPPQPPQVGLNAMDPKMPPDVCKFQMDHGPCYAELPRLFYDLITKDCVLFIYGGCQGNPNNFVTKEECERVCTNHTLNASPVSIIPHNMYTPASYQNVHYRSADVMHRPQTVNASPVSTFPYYMYPLASYHNVYYRSPDVMYRRPDRCNQPVNPGKRCMTLMHRWYFNTTTKKCMSFTYVGCYGNSNNFLEKKDCERVCMAPSFLSGSRSRHRYHPYGISYGSQS